MSRTAWVGSTRGAGWWDSGGRRVVEVVAAHSCGGAVRYEDGAAGVVQGGAGQRAAVAEDEQVGVGVADDGLVRMHAGRHRGVADAAQQPVGVVGVVGQRQGTEVTVMAW
ncbi:hypothetical protein EDD40_0293 [Saccharothrix texasensis]|uniref:Uncharacterized protein n=1 Tax=Saccharothrix texasensis TaxID=103734 RepID=A0A3N1GXV7_9PSEU|nr:hypothetical protein EDD40_0293 [Saccharothrix texasensis]